MAVDLVRVIALGTDLGMIIGPCVGYMVQIRKMYAEKKSEGFSTYVSFILILSNLIRVFWWAIDDFSDIILKASVLMIICQLSLLYFWVNINNDMYGVTQLESPSQNFTLGDDEIQSEMSEPFGVKTSPVRVIEIVNKTKIVSRTKDFIDKNEILNTNTFNSTNFQEEADIFVEGFWYWTKYTYYLMTLLLITILFSGLTYLFHSKSIYVETLGLLSSLIEAMLGVPQLYLNYSRKNTKGLAPLLIFMWLFGDLFKLGYYLTNELPLQLQCCSGFQVLVDLLILSQFRIYRSS